MGMLTENRSRKYLALMYPFVSMAMPVYNLELIIYDDDSTADQVAGLNVAFSERLMVAPLQAGRLDIGLS